MFSFSILHNQKIRADKFITDIFEGVYSRSQIRKGFLMNQITICRKSDGLDRPFSNASYELQRGDEISMSMRKISSTLLPDHRPLEIIFENKDFLVVSKDAGINSHPTASPQGNEGTLVNQLIAQIHDFDRTHGEDRPGIIHRLDKDTSGLMIVAKNDHSLRGIQKLIHDHEVKKTYLALVYGIPQEPNSTIKSYIGRDPNSRTKMTIKNAVEPREAITHYKILETFTVKRGTLKNKEFSLLEVTLETGRTHQIRVHMAAINHPIVGDSVYGDEKVNTWAEKNLGLGRQFLHAWKLDFTYESEHYEFIGKLKPDLEKALKQLKEEN